MCEDLRRKSLKRKDSPPEIVWFWGDAGCGKSHTAHEEAGPDAYTHSTMDSKWWDRYTGELNVIIDELRPKDIDMSHLLKMFDKYPMQVPQRGRAPMPWLAERIWVTSPLSPEEFYNQSTVVGQFEQLKRRLTRVVHFTKPFSV